MLRNVRRFFSEALFHSKCKIRWMSKEPAEIFERAGKLGLLAAIYMMINDADSFYFEAEEGFIRQVNRPNPRMFPVV